MQSKTERSTTFKQSRRLIVAAACLSSVLAGTGCRSSSGWATPSWNSFGWKKEPSADALAGKGPTVTYPTSPSAGQTPAAINSIAASPSGAQPQTSQLADNVRPAPSGAVAANPVSPAAATPNGPAINPAAAAANGFPSYAAAPKTAAAAPAGGGATSGGGTTSGAGTTSGGGAPNGGYVFGQNPAAPGALAPSGNQTAAASFAQAGTASAAASPSDAAPSFGMSATPAVNSPTKPSAAYTAVGYPMPAKSPSLASQAAAEASPEKKSSTPTTSSSLGDGFALPPDGPPAPSSSGVAKGGFVMPGMDGDESDAGEPEAKTATAPKTSTVAPAGGYAPGSTGGSAGYPAMTAGGDDDSGGFYR